MKKALVIIATLAAYAVAAVMYFIYHNHTAAENLVALGNFIIFVALLVKFGGPAIKNYFSNSAHEYEAKVQEAANLLADAKKVHDDWAERRAGLEAEAQRIKEEAQRAAQTQSEQILENARQMASRLVADAERTAANEILRAQDGLRDELVRKLLAKAEEKLQGRLTPAHQRELIDEAIRKLEASE
ncbi:MAG: F0F1 ATP synthase subunit B family protein [Alphaproteobacteria bacterium]